MHMLSAREARRENISKLLNEYEVIVSLKTVVPGEEKKLTRMQTCDVCDE